MSYFFLQSRVHISLISAFSSWPRHIVRYQTLIPQNLNPRGILTPSLETVCKKHHRKYGRTHSQRHHSCKRGHINLRPPEICALGTQLLSRVVQIINLSCLTHTRLMTSYAGGFKASRLTHPLGRLLLRHSCCASHFLFPVTHPTYSSGFVSYCAFSFFLSTVRAVCKTAILLLSVKM